MTGPSSVSNPENSAASHSATSLLGSGDGVMRYASPDGRTTVPSGPRAVHVSPSVQPGKNRASMTSGISGHTSHSLSRSVALSRSLASRLRRRLSTAGSIRLQMTWKTSGTRSGRGYFLLRRSARLTDENGCTSWPTPIVRSADLNSRLFQAAWSMDSGRPPSEFDHQTESGVQLNPEFVLWLMGFPAIWASCGARAMRSCRLRRRSLSGPSSRLKPKL